MLAVIRRSRSSGAVNARPAKGWAWWGRRLLVMVGLALLGWHGFPGCSAPGATCADKVCVVTGFKRCSSNADCCCTHSCREGCCLPPGAAPSLACTGAPDGGPLPDTPLPDGSLARCATGQKRACFPGSLAALVVGLCKAGEQTCEDGQWGDCTGYVLPVAEVCDDQDNDCDGSIDEGAGCGCKPNETRACGEGDCVGQQACDDQKTWGLCVPTSPKAEVCDGTDNDCDGLIDDGAGCPELAAAVRTARADFVQLWDWKTGGSLRLIGDLPATPGEILALAFSPDHKHLAVATAQPLLRVWDPDEGGMTQELGDSSTAHTDAIGAVAFTPDSRAVISGDDAGQLKLWDIGTGMLQVTLKDAHKGPIRSIIALPQGGQFLSAGDDGKIAIWDILTGVQIGTIDAKGAIVQMAIDAKGEKVAAIVGKRLEIWDIASKASQKVYNSQDDFVGLVVSQADGNILVTCTQDGIQRWDLSAQGTSPQGSWTVDSAVFNQPRGIALDKGGELVAVIGERRRGNKTKGIYLFDFQQPDVVRLRDALGAATAVAFRP